MTDDTLPLGVRCAALFFASSGLADIGLTWPSCPGRSVLASLEALGSGLLYALLALGLVRRFALCRSIAMVYCLASLVTYAAILAMALGQAPLAFPRSVFVSSLFEVPSCALLLPYLRSREAALFFRRPLL